MSQQKSSAGASQFERPDGLEDILSENGSSSADDDQPDDDEDEEEERSILKQLRDLGYVDHVVWSSNTSMGKGGAREVRGLPTTPGESTRASGATPGVSARSSLVEPLAWEESAPPGLQQGSEAKSFDAPEGSPAHRRSQGTWLADEGNDGSPSSPGARLRRLSAGKGGAGHRATRSARNSVEDHDQRTVPPASRAPDRHPVSRGSVYSLWRQRAPAPGSAMSENGQTVELAGLRSVGSILHGSGKCRPCYYAFRSKAGCRFGFACMYCHGAHPKEKKPRPSKHLRLGWQRFAEEAFTQAGEGGLAVAERLLEQRIREEQSEDEPLDESNMEYGRMVLRAMFRIRGLTPEGPDAEELSVRPEQYLGAYAEQRERKRSSNCSTASSQHLQAQYLSAYAAQRERKRSSTSSSSSSQQLQPAAPSALAEGGRNSKASPPSSQRPPTHKLSTHVEETRASTASVLSSQQPADASPAAVPVKTGVPEPTVVPHPKWTFNFQ
uniref:C3H1-type domain-containing protein n=1 Tax=Alexandrium catenella TaxID=2925 RepID=A0A7S1RA03_ALECA|mmetsp:Transcript_4975/g.13254  ORF Transcript_4975/g.13254 Transcript_4975/m.13254 type:complete len:496 (+) Transcript_4975:80-1567(+)